MAVNFNGEMHTELPADLVMIQRAAFYQDCLFETIRVFNQFIPWMDQHWDRLRRGLEAMYFDLPGDWDALFFQRQIQRFQLLNARVRLLVWRAPGGLYLPEDNTPRFLITTLPLPDARFAWEQPGLSMDCCHSVRLPVDHYSGFKTLNTSRYVVAAAEARSRGLDDVILLNTSDGVCEATSSNVFWWEGPVLCTVPLSAGCVAGIMRKTILALARMEGLAVQEKPATFATLESADEVFVTNAIRGIVPVRFLAGTKKQQIRTWDLLQMLNQFLNNTIQKNT
ncbi:MAG: hypothetical protein EP344_10720 [Bacteroidetes bacterium]|nr:MAG: hypothetical protein EP344_10720 [Bacteroidota bacterium]